MAERRVIPSSMTLTSSTSFHDMYQRLLWELLVEGKQEVNERTGATIFGSPRPVHLNVDLRTGLLPTCGIRKTFPRTAAAEVAWFLIGTKDVSFIREYAPIWDKFVEDDGHTVAGAYGHRWRSHFGRDQVQDAIWALRNNPSDRRVYVSAWDPGADGLGRPSKNVPCPVGFTLSIVDGRLNSALMIRSSDVFVGLPYDVMGHALLMRAIASSVFVDMGHMSVTLAHPHLYGVHEEMAVEALGDKDGHSTDTMVLPRLWTVARIEDDPHGYVASVAEMAKQVRQPAYMCRPEVVA